MGGNSEVVFNKRTCEVGGNYDKGAVETTLDWRARVGEGRLGDGMIPLRDWTEVRRGQLNNPGRASQLNTTISFKLAII